MVLANGTGRVSVHAEDEDRLLSRQGIAVSAETVEAHPDWRDVEFSKSNEAFNSISKC